MAAPPIQRTEKGLKYELFMKSVRDTLDGMTSEQKEKAKRANLSFIKGLADPRHRADHVSELEKAVQKAVTPGAVHVDSLLATMSVMYKNDEYIGESLMPVVPVSKRSDKFAVYPKRERFAFPDDEIGARGVSNEVDASRQTDNYSVKDYGLSNFLDLETVQNQDAPLNEMVDVVEAINEGISFRREKRILSIVFTAGSYGTNTAAAASNWTAANTGGSVIADVLGARSALWTGSNPTKKIGFCTLAVWNSNIANNLALRDLFKYTQSGLATTTQVANFFGLDDILVSRAREDTANIGQAASYGRIATGQVFGIISAAIRPSVRSLHFGSTFRMKDDPFTTQWTDPKLGKRGGIYARVATSEDHKIVASDAGFLITGI